MGQHALIATAPTRLDFGGGWTDVPPYPEERGGFVCNLAIARLARVRLSRASHSNAEAADSSDDPLVQAALRHAHLHDAHPNDAPLNDVQLFLDSDFPVAAGLGGSSAAGVALAAAIHAFQQRTSTLSELAEWSRAVEVEQLGVAGGRQDHYAAAYGGALGLTFTERTDVHPIPLSPPMIAALEHQCLVFYTGESRISSTTITGVLHAYRDREPRVVNALARMAALARDMQHALVNSDVAALAAHVHEHWVHQRSLHPGISTERIDAIESHARAAGATAMKALGASGGGCVMIFAPADRVDAVASAVSSLATRLSWRVAHHGVVVSTAEGSHGTPVSH